MLISAESRKNPASRIPPLPSSPCRGERDKSASQSIDIARRAMKIRNAAMRSLSAFRAPPVAKPLSLFRGYEAVQIPFDL
jgi:hypothetical protein